MQCNQPFENLPFESRPVNVFYQTIPPHRIIGEGEVNSVTFSDGSMHMYFIPTIRYGFWPPYPNTLSIDNLNKSKTTEYWIVRNITNPVPTSFNNQLQNLYESSLPKQQFDLDYNTNLTPCPKYYQNFHNDNTTSTTDILYFYPCLRQEKILYNSELIQTNVAPVNCNISYDGVDKQPCGCKVSFKVKQKDLNARCGCRESVSAMSIDSLKNKASQHSINNKNFHQSKHKNFGRKCKSKHICECNIGVKTTSNKLITTYADRACGNVERVGRDTQTTQKSKRSDINTEIWVPIKRKSRRKSNTLTNNFSDSTSCSSHCECASSTCNDSQ